MKLINVCEEIMEVFEMTGFTDILTIEYGATFDGEIDAIGGIQN